MSSYSLSGVFQRLLPATVTRFAESVMSSGPAAPQGAADGESSIPQPSGEQTPDACNTGVMTRQSEVEGYVRPLETGGLDTVHVSIYAECAQSSWGLVKYRLDELMGSAQDAPEQGLWETAGGDSIMVLPTGGRVGEVYYRWRCEWQGCQIWIMNRAEFSETMPLILVQFKSLPLMMHGLTQLYLNLVQVLNIIGYRIRRHVVGRVDVCVDLPNRKVSDFVALAVCGHEVTKAGGGDYRFGRTFEDAETFYRGNRSRCLLRIYDKLNDPGNCPVKLDILREQRWGGVVPEFAVRAEFQCSREILRERFAITTIDDLRDKLPSLCEFLTDKWYRLAANPVDRDNRNQSREATHPLWLEVQAAFQEWSTKLPIKPAPVERRVFVPKADALRKQMWGVCKTLMAVQFRDFQSAREIYREVLRDLKTVVGEVIADIGVRRVKLEQTYGEALAVAWEVPFDVPAFDPASVPPNVEFNGEF